MENTELITELNKFGNWLLKQKTIKGKRITCSNDVAKAVYDFLKTTATEISKHKREIRIYGSCEYIYPEKFWVKTFNRNHKLKL